MTLVDRLVALSAVTTLGAGRLPEELLGELHDLDGRAGARLRLSGEHTVVALAGATGSGKSSLFNAVVGAPWAAVGVRRPTTSSTQAAVFGTEGATELLDWLQVPTRRYADPAATPELAGLVLLDLPDHDSTEASHRAEVDRLVRLVDAFVWVLDPQKYADAVLHEAYLRPLAAHREVMVVVLNQADRLPPADLTACLSDLERLLAEDGLAGVPVLATSALSPAGTEPLRRFLASTVAEHRARTARVGADLDAVAVQLAPLAPPQPPTPALQDAQRRLDAALAAAAGVPMVVDAVARAYERRGLAAAGWPPLRWLSALRPDPLRRLGLTGGDNGGTGGGNGEEVLRRTSLPSASAATRAAVDTAVRSLADTAAAGLPAPWPRKLLEAAKSHTAAVPDALDRAVGGADLTMRRPRWWTAVGTLQWVLFTAAVVGGVWLGLHAVLAYLQLHLDAPTLGPFAWPTVLLIGGLAAGLLLRLLIRPVIAVGAARRRRRALAVLHQRVGAVGEEFIVAPLRAELQVYAQLSEAIGRLAGDRSRKWVRQLR